MLVKGHCLGDSRAFQNNGPSIVFTVSKQGADGNVQIYSGFVMRVKGQLKGYLNVCAHTGLRLNGSSSELLNRDGTLLYCRSHGASYESDTGLCVHGPCKGLSLIKLGVLQKQGQVLLADEVYKFHE